MKTRNRFRGILFASGLILSAESAALGQNKAVTIAPGPSWPCSAQRKDLPQLMRLREKMVADSSNPNDLPNNTMQRFADALRATHSIMVGTKARVTILTSTAGAHRVSVASRTGYPAGYQADTARGCWIDGGALNGAR